MNRSRLLRLAPQLFSYVFGLLVLAFGIAFAVNSGLGVSPVTSLPYMLSLITGVPLSWCIIGVYSVFLLLQAVLLGRSFHPSSLLQLISAFLFGFMNDLTAFLARGAVAVSYPGQLSFLALSIVLIGIGLMFYVEAGLVPMPSEGLTITLANRLHIPFHKMKVIMDCTLVSISVVLSLVFFRRLNGVREGTIITAALAGWSVAGAKRLFAPLLRVLLKNETPQAKQEAELLEQVEGVRPE